MGSTTTPLSGERINRWHWLWILPRLAFILFVGGVALLLWMSDRADKEEQRATLISDILWLEQNLRFHLARNEELLGRIDVAHTSDAKAFESYARTMFGFESGLRQVIWLGSDGAVRLAHPAITDSGLAGETGEAIPSQQSYRLARSLGKPVYSKAYPYFMNDWQFEVHVPVSREGRIAGVAVGVYRIRDLLGDSVPWWLAERYRISVTEDSGKVLGSRSKVESTVMEEGYQVGFDPPGSGLALHAVPYHAPRPLASILLSASLVILAMIVLWSLWILRRHVVRRQDVEEQLRQEHAFRKAMEDSLDTGMRARNLDGEIIYVNPAFCRMVGWSAAELIGRRPPMPYWADDFLDETRALSDSVLAGEGPEEGFELKFKRRNGNAIDVLIHEAPLIDARGQHFGWMGSLVDITERKQADERARQQQDRLQSTARLVAMGEMASSIAHELNQPLAAISSYCTGAANLLRNETPAAEVLPALDKAVEQAQRAGQVIRRIYSLARHSEDRFELIRLEERIDDALALMEVDIRQKGIRVTLDIQAKSLVEGDPVLLEQALFNLFRNATESMRDTVPDQRQIGITLGSADGYAQLTIADRGCGIDADVADKLFDPLFTTKAEGMGMGLAICRSVVENHRGRLSFEANPGGGTVFHILLPLAPVAPQ
ncbi:MAG: PAS domain S-box protein [Rhodocyclales bacterium]|nr:PAS domain S-box protein [Rhodocyclales bacterium]